MQEIKKYLSTNPKSKESKETKQKKWAIILTHYH
jgi:hypothetical protein